MGTHTRHTFLNSCVKTPIDPCNKCPAPIYNRPKVYLGRLAAVNSLSKIKQNNITTNSLYWPSTGIRSLAKFYDTIPDYCDINHLNEEEFYTTLNCLRSTCQELKTKSILIEESSNSSPLSLITTCTKPKKSSKKKTGSTKKSTNNKKSKCDKKIAQDKDDSKCFPNTPNCGFLEVPQITRSSSLNCKQDFYEEVDAFKKTLKNYEDELKKRAMSRCLGRAKSSSFLAKLDVPTIKVDENTQTESACLTPKPTTPNCSNTLMRKSFSSNDIDSITDMDKKNAETEQIIELKPNCAFTKLERSVFKDKTRFSDNFFEKPFKDLSPTASELPKITVQSPTSEVTTSNTTTERTPISHFKKEKQSKKKKTHQIKDNFGIFELGSNSAKKEIIEVNTPSPIHPVARPNLAATLRAEVSKKKVKDLQNNCTYHESTPQFDWEVRKTPAWRLLSLNESHKEILALRLATRKAEQAMQQREYEYHMELMRQRVKSAPLLLEGSTFWGPNVGKLSHNCQNEGTTHACDGFNRKQRKKSVVEQDQHHQQHCHIRNKMNEIQKIYGCTGKTPSQSRSSQRSAASTQRCRKDKKRSATLPREGLLRPPTLQESSRFGGNESGDDLCSVDRAFL